MKVQLSKFKVSDPTNLTLKASQIYNHLIKSNKRARYLYLINENYVPGTVTIAERYQHFTHSIHLNNFQEWIIALIKDFIYSISIIQDLGDYNSRLINKLTEIAFKILTFKIQNFNKSIVDIATIQQTTDIVNRTVKIILFSDQFHKIHINKEFNELGKCIAFDMIDHFINMNLKDQIKFSVVSGTVGYEIKNSFKSCIPSSLITDRVIRIYENDNRVPNDTIFKNIMEKIKDDFVIDQIDQFISDVTQNNTKLAFFTDDYIESIFDMIIISKLLRQNPDLGVTLIPRNGQYANDFSCEDSYEILENNIFNYLRTSIGKRFNIIETGPKGSGISINEFSDKVLDVIKESSLVLFKGARVFEMVSGVNKKCYFAFNIIHEQSSLLTGISAKNAPSIFVKQEPSEVLFNYKNSGEILTTIDILKYEYN